MRWRQVVANAVLNGLRIPMRGYEVCVDRYVILVRLVTNPHEGL